jgi:NAD(P)-dependent dehydrogenase (short-subunit alcohol dehydrogenase family)
MKMPTGRLAGKRALVTGAGSGIGEATALLFAREGARVGLLGRSASKLERVDAQIRAAGGEALVLQADVQQEPAIEAAVDRLTNLWGGLDLCVAVAGIEPWDTGDASVDALDLAVWQEVIGVNLTGMFITCKHAVRAMLATGGGALVVTGSPTGKYGIGLGQHAYSASKAGCHGLARIMASEYAQRGIRVNCVIPGFIDTPLTRGVFANPTWLDRVTSRIPLRRAGSAAEVAAMNLWLCSDDATFAIGGEFVVDGGETAV